jgi:hypothetical protein
MTKVEIRMTKEIRNPKLETELFQVSNFVLASSLGILTFDIP